MRMSEGQAAGEPARRSGAIYERTVSADVFSPEELRALRRSYFERLTDGERRILEAFEGPLRDGAPEEARLAAFAELRRSRRLRDYVEAEEACRVADRVEALGVRLAPRGDS